MKYIAILLLFLFVLEGLSVVVKTKKTNLLAKKNKVKVQRTRNIDGYAEYILKELNHFRRKEHYSPYIRWLNSLAATGLQSLYVKMQFLAGREADHINNKNSFGEHSNFGNWRKEINSKYFTELALIVDTEGIMPPKRIFAKTIIEALKQEQEWYLIHAYTHAGVAIIPGKKRNIYVVVLHLIRRPSKFRSCAEAGHYGYKKNKLTIFPKGKKVKVVCNQKLAGGGWTRILDMNKQTLGASTQAINDFGLHYTQIYFKARNNYWFDYAKGGKNGANGAWDFNGYVFSLNALRFNDVWYLSKQAPSHGGQRNKMKHQYFDMNDKKILRVIKGANTCKFGRANKPKFCAKQFILKRLPKGRLNAISDVESQSRSTLSDNQWKQFYEIYVR